MMDRTDEDRAATTEDTEQVAVSLHIASWDRVCRALRGRGSIGDCALASLIERRAAGRK